MYYCYIIYKREKPAESYDSAGTFILIIKPAIYAAASELTFEFGGCSPLGVQISRSFMGL
jgi:hypothetical protein